MLESLRPVGQPMRLWLALLVIGGLGAVGLGFIPIL